MASFCHNVDKWIKETIEKPVEEFEKRQERRCREESCNWWTLCLNKLFCWLVVVVEKIVRIVVITVTRLVTRVVCEAVSRALDVVAAVVNLVLSIPVIGGFIRAILNWVTEIVWRLVGLIDFGLSLLGVRWKKHMYVGLLIPRSNGFPITTEAAMMPQIERAKQLYKRLCNIEIVYTGACVAPLDAPLDALTVGCDAGGFFSDWWFAGSYIEFCSASCKFRDGWRRVLGLGAEIIVVPVFNVTPDPKTGCSYAATHNYLVVEPTARPVVAAHEIGHTCMLLHRGDEPDNLMFPATHAVEPTLTDWQVSVVRSSKHCVYF